MWRAANLDGAVGDASGACLCCGLAEWRPKFRLLAGSPLWPPARLLPVYRGQFASTLFAVRVPI